MKRLVIAAILASSATFAGLGAFAQEKKTEKEKLTFEVFKDAKGEFRWRLKAANSKTIADSGEGYKNKADCLHGIDLIKENAAKATTDDKS